MRRRVLPSGQVVHVIDDDIDVRQSLAFLLSTAGLAVRVYESAVAFLKALPHVQDGCIVTDVRMPEMDGLELQRKLTAAKSTMPVIVITGHGDVALAVEAMKAGAVDFIEKPFDDEHLLSAIRSALAHHEGDRERGSKAAEIRSRLVLLSDRERQVLDGLVAGKPNKVIAYDLGISARTVEIYRANVMTKMQADSLSSLVRMVLVDSASHTALR
jgi:two-component system response regulator FixJ